METLNTIRIIAEIILFAALAILAVTLIVYVKRINSSIDKVQLDITEITNKVSLLSIDISGTLEEVKKISSTVNTEVTKIKGFTDKAIETGQEVLKQTKKITSIAGSYVGDGVNFVTAIKNGIKVFKTKIAA